MADVQYKKHAHNFKDLTGRKFGRWTVVSCFGRRCGKVFWSCRCECGTESTASSSNLRCGKTTSCGCRRSETIKNKSLDLTGQSFGRLTVIALIGNRYGKNIWSCSCSCGGKTESTTGNLRSGIARSCGCLRLDMVKAKVTTHGRTRTAEYRVWQDMRKRCYNCECEGFKNYGARGIYVCTEWLADFSAFFQDMGERPSSRYSIERKDNNGPYCKENCKWVTRTEQGANKRNNVNLSLNGETHCANEWSRITGISVDTIKQRIRAGWSDQEALTTPIGQWKIDGRKR